MVPARWREFQHYKDRCPPWVKVHRELLDDRAYMDLPLAAKGLLTLLWILASESASGEISCSAEDLAWRLRIPCQELLSNLQLLSDTGLVEDASNMLADASTALATCLQVAPRSVSPLSSPLSLPPDGSGEPPNTGVAGGPVADPAGETSAQQQPAATAASSTCQPLAAQPSHEVPPADHREPPPADRRSRAKPGPSAGQYFENFWTVYGKKVDRAAAEKAWTRAKLETATQETLLMVLDAACAYVEATPDKQFRKHAATWINGRCWLNETVSQAPVLRAVSPVRNQRPVEHMRNMGLGTPSCFCAECVAYRSKPQGVAR